jgi:hypothetical protein
MSLFDNPEPSAKRASRDDSFFRVYTHADSDGEYDHDPGCTMEAVAVGNQAHYVVKRLDGKIDAMYPFSSVECIQLVKDE